jgi:hypothetical protein
METEQLEQVEIVKHYLDNILEYKLDDGKWWENLIKSKLHDKSDEYIMAVSDLIDECIDDGRDAFNFKYSEVKDQ